MAYLIEINVPVGETLSVKFKIDSDLLSEHNRKTTSLMHFAALEFLKELATNKETAAIVREIEAYMGGMLPGFNLLTAYNITRMITFKRM